MFACLVAGNLVQTNYQEVSDKQIVFLLDSNKPIKNLSVFLTGTSPLPEGYGAIVYFCWPPFEDKKWQVLGYISNSKPSAFFSIRQAKELSDSGYFNQNNVGFGTNTPMYQNTTTAMVGVELDTLDNIKHQFGHSNRDQNETSPQNLTFFCQKMLDNFYNYASSFVAKLQTVNGYVEALPLKAFDQWYKNFEAKLAKNPDFWKE